MKSERLVLPAVPLGLRTPSEVTGTSILGPGMTTQQVLRRNHRFPGGNYTPCLGSFPSFTEDDTARPGVG